jgi:CHAD domain-containing protein
VKAPSPDDSEIEWQLDALDLRPVERWLAGLPGQPDHVSFAEPAPGDLAATVTALPRPAERLVDTYVDTADWRMGRSGFVVRIRHRGGRGEVTLKDVVQAKEGLRRRLEVTEPLPTDGVGALGASGPVGWRVHALAGKRVLQPVLEVRTRRRPYDLCVEGERVAEVALDETTIVVGDDHQPVRLQRVEVEVTAPWVKRLTPLVEALRRECGLQPATLSKFEAGILAAGLRMPSPPELGPASFDADPSVGEVAFAVLRKSFRAVLAHETGTRLGEDPEELHDMRVATRRTRAALSLFADALPVRARHVRTELGWLAGVLGAVRDLDVQLERMEGWIEGFPPDDRSALSDLAILLERQREEARRALLACLESARYERLVAGFATMLRQGPSRRSAAARAPAAAVVPGLIAARHRSANKAARRAQHSGEPDDFHLTRIRVKRLRYALEFVSEIYDKRTAKYLRHVVKLQDALGLMQDARVAAARLQQLATAEGSTLSPMTVFVMGGVTERYRHESESLARKVPGLLHELRGPQWRDLVALMERRRAEVGVRYRWPVPPSTPPAVRTVPAQPAVPATPVAPDDLAAPVSGAAQSQMPDPHAPHPPGPDPTATHPAANRPGAARLVPTSWTAEPVSSPPDAPDLASNRPAPRPSSNGESPHP